VVTLSAVALSDTVIAVSWNDDGLDDPGLFEGIWIYQTDPGGNQTPQGEFFESSGTTLFYPLQRKTPYWYTATAVFLTDAGDLPVNFGPIAQSTLDAPPPPQPGPPPPPAPSQPPGPPPKGIGTNTTNLLSVAALPDGRLQLFALKNGRGTSYYVASAWQSSVIADPTGPENWAFDPTFLGIGGVAYSELFAVPLALGKIQLWVVDQSQNLLTMWKESSDPNAGWTAPNEMDPPPPEPPKFAIAARSIAGRGQIWTIGTTGGTGGQEQLLFTTWKASPTENSPWLPWQLPMDPSPPDVHPQWCLGVGHLSDGRLQVWAHRADGTMDTTWKTAPHPNASWAPWAPMVPQFSAATSMAVGNAGNPPNEITQLWAIGFESFSLSTTWKMSPDSNSGWWDWQKMEPDPGPVESVAVAKLPDGRLQLFVLQVNPQGRYDDPRTILTSVKQTTDPGAAWTNWRPLW
jgi:hypothetical protein